MADPAHAPRAAPAPARGRPPARDRLRRAVHRALGERAGRPGALRRLRARRRGESSPRARATPPGARRCSAATTTSRRSPSRAAAANFRASRDGVIRRYDSYVGRLPSIAAATTQRLTGRRPRPGERRLIDFPGGAGTIPTVSFVDVLRGRVPARALRGKIVVVGASAPSLQDLHRTAAGSDVSGPEIQAAAIATALHGNPLRDAPAWLLVLSVAAVGPAPRAALPAPARRRRARGAARRRRARAGRRAAGLRFGPRRRRGRAAARRRPGRRGDDRLRIRRRDTGAPADQRPQRRAAGRGRRPDRRAARDAARVHPPPGPRRRAARRRHRRAPRAHEPAVRAPGAGDRHGAPRRRRSCATPACCTTSARSASPTGCCASPGGSPTRSTG